MADESLTNKTTEELEVRAGRAAQGTFPRIVQQVFTPGIRRDADAAKIELDKRKAQAPQAPASAAKPLQFKHGGLIPGVTHYDRKGK